MQSRLPIFASPAEKNKLISWQVNEALVSAWQHIGVSNLDKGFEQLLRVMMGLMQTHYLRCTLEDTSNQLDRVTVTQLAIGLRMVEGVASPAFSLASCIYELRPGRRLLFEFSPALLGRDFNQQALSTLLTAQHRWLLWFDLSYGPLNDEGIMDNNQRQVLLCLLKGLSEKQIASALQMSLFTTHEIVRKIYRRFQVRSRASLMSCWLNGQEKTADPDGFGGLEN